MGYILFNLLMTLICVVSFLVVVESDYSPKWARALTAFLLALSVFLTATVIVGVNLS